MCYFYSETTKVKRIYICISHWNFIVIRSETNEKMDLKVHYPQNTISHCIISNETKITLHFLLGRISAMPVAWVPVWSFFLLFLFFRSLVKNDSLGNFDFNPQRHLDFSSNFVG